MHCLSERLQVHGKIVSWKNEEWKLEVDISEGKQNEVKRKPEAKIERAEEKAWSRQTKLTKQIFSGNSIGRGPSLRVWQSNTRQQ